MKARFTILLVSVFLFSSFLSGQDRGMKPVQVPVDGKTTTLYNNSHALLIGVVMNPTSDQLYRAFTDFINLYGHDLDNRLLFFFAGHGYTLKTAWGEELGYLVPVNAPNPNYDPGEFQNQAMEMAQVEI